MAVLLDASAVLAVLLGESGADRVEAEIGDSAVSAVNSSEVVAKLVDKGLAPETATAVFDGLLVPVVAFTPAVAASAGRLRADTRGLGLSLGDRACLAQADASDLTVLTSDRSWAGLDIGVRIEVIR